MLSTSELNGRLAVLVEGPINLRQQFWELAKTGERLRACLRTRRTMPTCGAALCEQYLMLLRYHRRLAPTAAELRLPFALERLLVYARRRLRVPKQTIALLEVVEDCLHVAYAAAKVGTLSSADLAATTAVASRVGALVADGVPELVAHSTVFLLQHRPPHDARDLYGLLEALAAGRPATLTQHALGADATYQELLES